MAAACRANVCACAVLLLLVAAAATVAADPGSKDWIDSPFTGQGDPPADGVNIYFSAFLDRLIKLDEEFYNFSATIVFIASFVDPRAPAQIADATEDAHKPGGTCQRWCQNTIMPTNATLCCDNMYLPSLILRNVVEYPQGRPQATQITVTDEGVVTWRVMMRADVYTNLDVSAFPYDTQTLDYHFSIYLPKSGGNVTIIPSARGIRLWTSGKGDDANGWKVTDLVIHSTREPYPRQFDDPAERNNVAKSHPDDPAPVAPGPGSAVTTPYGDDMDNISMTISIVVKRLSTYFSMSVILPVITCSLISFVAFHVDPASLDCRLQLTVGLFLALVAIQFVAEGSLPRASYVIPTRQLVILSYCVLLAVSIESVVVHKILTRDEAEARKAHMRAAHAAHAAHARSQAEGGSMTKRLMTWASIAVTRPPGGGAAREWVGAAAAAAAASAHAEAGSTLSPAAAKAAAAADLERGYNAWRAATIDRVCFWTLLFLYLLIAVLIFVIAYARAPSVCQMLSNKLMGDCNRQIGRAG